MQPAFTFKHQYSHKQTDLSWDPKSNLNVQQYPEGGKQKPPVATLLKAIS